jgi:CheY-like chemotaxis protein
MADVPSDTRLLPDSDVTSPAAAGADLPLLTHLDSYANPSPLTPPSTLPAREPSKPLVRSISESTTAQIEPVIRPILPAYPEGTVPTIATLPPPPISRVPNILLVDDNRINLQLLVTFMKKSKFNYTAASDGLEALNAYKAAADILLSTPNTSSLSPTSPTSPISLTPPTRPAFDYILMDISMPIMDGNESTRHIRAYEKEKKLPPSKIFALTGLASASAQEESFASGVNHFLPKPVNFKELKAMLEKIDEIAESESGK